MKPLRVKKSDKNNLNLPKSPTGIQGLDEITNGGFPKNRPTLLLGNTGSGKTVMAMEFLINGIEMFDEPAVFMAFEEKKEELVLNVKSLGFDLDKHITNNKLYVEQVLINPDDMRETGMYDLEGLFVRLEQAIYKVTVSYTHLTLPTNREV